MEVPISELLILEVNFMLFFFYYILVTNLDINLDDESKVCLGSDILGLAMAHASYITAGWVPVWCRIVIFASRPPALWWWGLVYVGVGEGQGVTVAGMWGSILDDSFKVSVWWQLCGLDDNEWALTGSDLPASHVSHKLTLGVNIDKISPLSLWSADGIRFIDRPECVVLSFLLLSASWFDSWCKLWAEYWCRTCLWCSKWGLPGGAVLEVAISTLITVGWWVSGGVGEPRTSSLSEESNSCQLKRKHQERKLLWMNIQMAIS